MQTWIQNRVFWLFVNNLQSQRRVFYVSTIHIATEVFKGVVYPLLREQ